MITVNAKTLLNAVKKANKIKNNSKLPIADAIELSVSDNQLTVYRFTMDIQYTEIIELEYECCELQTICIGCNELYKVLTKQKGNVRLSVVENNLVIKGKYDFTLPGTWYDAEDLPKIDMPFFDTYTGIDPGPLTWLKKALSVDVTRYTLNGIFLDSESNCIVATDGNRLHKYSTTVTDTGIVPGKLLALIYSDCKIKIVNDRVFIKDDTGIYCSKLVEGTYSNYKQVIPTSFTDKINIDLDFVKESLAMIKDGKAWSLRIDSKNHSVSNKQLNMSSDCENTFLEKDNRDMFFNRQYLVDMIIDPDHTVLDINDEYKPARYLSGSYMAIIMPMRN